MLLRLLRPAIRTVRGVRKGVITLLDSTEIGRSLLYEIENKGAFDDIHMHEIMVADAVRVNTYYEGIRRHINPGDVVVDLGTGTGILSLFAAQQHPRKIYAIDHSDFIHVAEEIATSNGVHDIEFVQENSRVFTPDEKVDVILHEQIGSTLIDENMIENILDLKKRVLKDTGKILPARFELYLEPVCLAEGFKIPYLWENSVHGVDFSFLKESEECDRFRRTSKLTIEHSAIDRFLCEPTPVLSFDLNEMKDGDELPKAIETSKRVVRAGTMDGLCLYFRVIFDDEIGFDTSPLSPKTSWMHPFFRTEGRPYEPGDQISFAFSMESPTKWESWTLVVR